MKKIHKVTREELDRECAKLGIKPLPEDSPYYSEGVTIQFASPNPGKTPINPRKQNPKQGTPSAE